MKLDPLAVLNLTDLYEMTPHGDSIQLAPFWSRMSYVGDRSHRLLLVAGKRKSISFQSVRLMIRKLQQGSRIVAVLKIIKKALSVDYAITRTKRFRIEPGLSSGTRLDSITIRPRAPWRLQ